jgi:TonB family protein
LRFNAAVKHIIAASAVAGLLSASAIGQTGASADFTPARRLSGSAPSLPSPNTIGAIDESLELAVDAAGHVQGVTAAQATPGPSLVSPAVADWRFQPATQSGTAVASRVLVAAIFRAPEWYDDASSSTTPVDLADRSSMIPFPTTTMGAVYPPFAVADAVAVVEVVVDPAGSVSAARLVTRAPGFESAALSAARGWSFRPAQQDGRPVSAYAYLVFGFRRPVS